MVYSDLMENLENYSEKCLTFDNMIYPMHVYDEITEYLSDPGSNTQYFNNLVDENSKKYKVEHVIDVGQFSLNTFYYTRYYGFKGNSPISSDNTLYYCEYILINPVE